MARSELLSPQGRAATLFGNPATLGRDAQALTNKMAKDDLRRRLLKGQGTGAAPAATPTASPEPPATAMKATLPTSFLYAVEKNRTAVGPTKANAAALSAAAPQALTPAPRADRGLALLDQMQNDRAAGVPVGSASALSGPGSTRKLESDAGKAERLARRYIKKFGRAGASAASGLLENAAAERMGTPGVKSEAYRKADQAIEAEAQGVAAQTTAIEKAELQDRIRRIEQGRTGKAGRGKPIKKPQP